ncbi:hypothetical protein [Crocosphaera sp. Alani8]
MERLIGKTIRSSPNVAIVFSNAIITLQKNSVGEMVNVMEKQHLQQVL